MTASDDIFQYEHPFVCTDAVVFSLETQESSSYRKLPGTSLKVLLYKRESEPFAGAWCLPGGFLDIDEEPETCIRRKLSEKSQVGSCYLEQLYTFSEIKRDPRARVISIAYLGLMSEREAQSLESEAAWMTLSATAEGSCLFEHGGNMVSAEDLGFDHYRIIATALERLRSKITYSNLALYLMPEEFTLTQLQNVYETILGKKDQAANFRRKVIGMVQETGRTTGDKGHRPAQLYTKRTSEIGAQ